MMRVLSEDVPDDPKLDGYSTPRGANSVHGLATAKRSEYRAAAELLRIASNTANKRASVKRLNATRRDINTYRGGAYTRGVHAEFANA